MKEALHRIEAATPVGAGLRCTSVAAIRPADLGLECAAPDTAFLTAQEGAPLRSTQVGLGVRSWGLLVTLVRRIGPVDRRLRLLYLGAEGVATYLCLFAGRRIAPAVLCLINAGTGFGGNWTNFLDKDGPLGRAVCNVPGDLPRLVIAERSADLSWPWKEPWQWFTTWDAHRHGVEAVARVRRDRPPPALTSGATGDSASPGGREGRDVGILRETLTPTSCMPGDDAALIPWRVWNQGCWAIVRGISTIVLHRPDDLVPPEVGSLLLAGGHMPSILAGLAEVCRAGGVARVMSIPVGFEDEGEFLRHWSDEGGLPRSLVIHCKSPGDEVALRPYTRS